MKIKNALTSVVLHRDKMNPSFWARRGCAVDGPGCASKPWVVLHRGEMKRNPAFLTFDCSKYPNSRPPFEATLQSKLKWGNETMPDTFSHVSFTSHLLAFASEALNILAYFSVSKVLGVIWKPLAVAGPFVSPNPSAPFTSDLCAIHMCICLYLCSPMRYTCSKWFCLGGRADLLVTSHSSYVTYG